MVGVVYLFSCYYGYYKGRQEVHSEQDSVGECSYLFDMASSTISLHIWTN